MGGDGVVFRESRGKIRLMLAGMGVSALVMAGIAAAPLVDPTIGWDPAWLFAVGAFLFCAGLFVRLLPRAFQENYLVVSDRGVEDHLTVWRFGLIAWEDVSRVWFSRASGLVFLYVALRDRAAFLARRGISDRLVTLVNADFRRDRISLPLSALRARADEAAEAIRRSAERSGVPVEPA